MCQTYNNLKDSEIIGFIVQHKDSNALLFYKKGSGKLGFQFQLIAVTATLQKYREFVIFLNDCGVLPEGSESVTCNDVVTSHFWKEFNKMGKAPVKVKALNKTYLHRVLNRIRKAAAPVNLRISLYR